MGAKGAGNKKERESKDGTTREVEPTPMKSTKKGKRDRNAEVSTATVIDSLRKLQTSLRTQRLKLT